MRRLIVLLSVVALFVVGAAPAMSAGPDNKFRTHLTGAEEVDPVDTKAQGQAIFKVSADGESISYKLIVANIEDVLMAHIHLAPARAAVVPGGRFAPRVGLEPTTNGLTVQRRVALC